AAYLQGATAEAELSGGFRMFWRDHCRAESGARAGARTPRSSPQLLERHGVEARTSGQLRQRAEGANRAAGQVNSGYVREVREVRGRMKRPRRFSCPPGGGAG